MRTGNSSLRTWMSCQPEGGNVMGKIFRPSMLPIRNILAGGVLRIPSEWRWGGDQVGPAMDRKSDQRSGVASTREPKIDDAARNQ